MTSHKQSAFILLVDAELWRVIIRVDSLWVIINGFQSE